MTRARTASSCPADPRSHESDIRDLSGSLLRVRRHEGAEWLGRSVATASMTGRRIGRGVGMCGGAWGCVPLYTCICTCCKRWGDPEPHPKKEALWTMVLANGDVVWTKHADYIREWQRFKVRKAAAGDPVPPRSRSQSQSAGAPAAGTAKKRAKSHGWKRSSASSQTRAPPPPPSRGTTSYSASLWATGGYEG